MSDRPFELTFGCFKGCVGIFVILFLLAAAASHISGCVKHLEESERTKEAQELARLQEQRRVETEKEYLRNFALRYAPHLWQTMIKTATEISNQTVRIEQLRHMLIEFGRDPEQDRDYQLVCERQNRLIHVSKTMRSKLEDAYLAARKSETIRDSGGYQALMREALDEGVMEAESVESYFKQVKNDKEKSCDTE